jgi:lysophospholipid acyltransferase (LPLAT)-like uncharacterized protein
MALRTSPKGEGKKGGRGAGMGLAFQALDLRLDFLLQKSWDRFLVPLPFGRICFAYGQPRRIAPDLTPEGLQQALDMLADNLDRLQIEVQAKN